MWPALVWIGLGYVSCVWDCSSSPLDPRWPSATGVFIVLLAMRVPSFSVWGAALCGLAMDAAHGGTLGPHVLAGVMATALVSHAKLGHAETRWPIAIVVCAAAIALWLAVPLAGSWGDGVSSSRHWQLAQSTGTTILSTTLIVLAIRALAARPEPAP